MDMDDDGGFPVEMAKERILTVCPPVARGGAYAQTAEHARLRAPQELQNTLGPTPFLHSKVDQWSTSIIENVLMKLKEINDEQLRLIQSDDGTGQLWKFVGAQRSPRTQSPDLPKTSHACVVAS